ncbi:putative ABC transporter permease subunit [Helcococcus kunzii]
MNDLRVLLKKKLGYYFDLKAFFNSEKNGKKIATAIFASIFILIYFVIAQMFLFAIYDIFLKNGAHKEIIIIAMAVYIFLIIAFYMPILIYKTYYSDDVKILLTLPVKSDNIMLSNLIFSSFSAMAYSLLFTLPMLIKVGRYLNKSILFYIIALIAIYLVTSIILSIVSFISTFVMKYINRSETYKKILRFISTLILMLVMIFLQVYIQIMFRDFASSQLIDKASDFTNKVYITMPYLKLMINALFADNALIVIMNILALAIIAGVLLYIIVKTFSKIMVQGILSAGSVKNKRNRKAGEIRNTSVIKEIMIKDIKNILSTPIFFMNKLLGGVIILVLLFLPMFTGEWDNTAMQSTLDMLRSFLNNFNLLTMGLVILGVMIITMFISNTSETTSSTFTREGKNIWLMKSLPIKATDQVNGRILASVIITILSGIPMLLALMYLLRPSILVILIILLTFLITIVFMSTVCLIPGILIVDTKWENPSKAIKGAKSLIPIAIFFVIAILMAGSVYLTVGLEFDKIGDSIFYIAISWLMVFIISTFILNKVLVKLYEKNLRKMD